MIGSSPNVMIVSPERPWKTVAGFHRRGQSKNPARSSFRLGRHRQLRCISAPEKFRFAGGGSRRTHVPLPRRAPEVIADVIGGRVDFLFLPLCRPRWPLIQAGRVRAAAGLDARSVPPICRNVPTPAEDRS